MNLVNNRIYDLGILPVIKIENADDAVPLARALADGELPAAEVTFRTKAAKAAIAAIAEECPDMLLGAGTVLTRAQVDDAVGAGAKFIVSPGLNPSVVEYCTGKGIPVYPGVNNPSQIEQALGLGLDTVKYFPAENSGGPEMLKAMSAPYGNMRFIPTGGINAGNIVRYLDFNQVVACGGSWMVPENLLAAKDFATITKLAREAVFTVLGFSFLHIGINNNSAAGAENTCASLMSLFGQAKERETENEVFIGDFEIMKNKGRGDHGHIAFRVNNMRRALAFMKRKGISIIEESVKRDEKGDVNFAYLELNLSGFAVHVKQKA